jgi:hypothetical protein
MIPHPLRRPLIRMTPPVLTAVVKAEQDVTVVPLPLPPPVVPTPKPTSCCSLTEPQLPVSVGGGLPLLVVDVMIVLGGS